MNNLEKAIKSSLEENINKVELLDSLEERLYKEVVSKAKIETRRDKINRILNREIEISVFPLIAAIVLICMIPISYSLYHKEKYNEKVLNDIREKVK